MATACASLIAFVFAASYTNHAPMVVWLSRELDFKQTQAGLLTTGIFLSHAALQVPGGHLADRLGPRRFVITAMAVVAVGNFAIAFCAAYWQLLRLVRRVGWRAWGFPGYRCCCSRGAS